MSANEQRNDVKPSKINQEYAESVKTMMLAVYENFLTLSPNCLDPVREVLEAADRKLNIDEVFPEFRTNLKSRCEKELTRTWAASDMDNKVVSLDLLIKKWSHSKDKKWRPSGKSVQEQVRPLKVNAIRKKIEYFEEMIANQRPEFDLLIKEVEHRRAQVNELLLRRERAEKQLSKELEQLDIEAEPRILHAVEKI